jgi:dTDP-4-amino-4,6-dideoxygalactose transaminase
MSGNPYDVVRQFESALCEYTGAKHAVTVTSCTMAILLACEYLNTTAGMRPLTISIPKRTYVGVAQSVLHAGCRLKFRDQDWRGGYKLEPYSVWDYARRFTSGMYVEDTIQCLSFHHSKILSISTHGGALLTDFDQAARWFRIMRFDGRHEGVSACDDVTTVRGYHCYLTPPAAAEGLLRLSVLPRHNDDLPPSDYPDLSLQPIFQ